METTIIGLGLRMEQKMKATIMGLGLGFRMGKKMESILMGYIYIYGLQ